MKVRGQFLSVACMFILLCSASRGGTQTLTSAGIVGVVKDASGSVLPGVTVEAASPALIEKVRSVVTDDQGRYRIIDLRPGVYSVTFTLPGFSAFKRDGLELTTGFTATVSADLAVGSVEETIQVSGSSPVVDTQNVMQGQVFTREVLDSLPVGKSVQAFAAMIPGAVVPATSQDVGGVVQGSQGFTIHGGPNDARHHIAGIPFDNPLQTGGNLGFQVNKAAVQEIAIETSGIGAESETGGYQMNVVPKDGGNKFDFSFATDYAGGGLQSNNLTDTLRARGLSNPSSLNKVYDISGGLGGPIKKDALWFYTAHRWVGSQVNSSVYFNATENTLFYTPDLNRRAVQDTPYKSNDGRMTWQASPRNKFSATYERQDNCNCAFQIAQGGRAPEATEDHHSSVNLGLVNWTFPATNHLLFEAAGSYLKLGTNQTPLDGVTPDTIAVQELSTNFFYGARGDGLIEGNSYALKTAKMYSQRFAMSYITGEHSFKTGILVQEENSAHTHTINQDITYRFQNGVPNTVVLFATPWIHSEEMKPIIGLFAQDQWTLKRLTLNLGARFDYLNASVPEQHLAAGTYVPVRDFAAVENVPNWKDVSPRIGAAYDVFGNSKTAIKFSLGRFVGGQGSSGLASLNNPANRMVGSATRTWTDANKDYIPQESELGPLSDSNFGKVVSNVTYAEDVLTANRNYSWQASALVQHELRSNMSVNLAYYRTWYGNFQATDNLATTPADFTPFCITAPTDPRLPGSGTQMCGFYDITPEKFGQVNNLVTVASHYGEQTNVYNGVDFTANARFGHGGLISGGGSTGQTVTDSCYVIDSPQALRFCHVAPPWSAATQLKVFGAYPLPWDFQASATLQNLPGIPVTSTYVASNAEIAKSLGRNLGSCRAQATCNGTLTLDLIAPGTLYEDRITQLDVRLTKNVRLGRVRAQGKIDLYNVLNASSVLAINTRYGSSWLNVNQALAGRLLKFGVQVDF